MSSRVQIWRAVEEELPDLDAQLEAGEFGPLYESLRDAGSTGTGASSRRVETLERGSARPRSTRSRTSPTCARRSRGFSRSEREGGGGVCWRAGAGLDSLHRDMSERCGWGIHDLTSSAERVERRRLAAGGRGGRGDVGEGGRRQAGGSGERCGVCGGGGRGGRGVASGRQVRRLRSWTTPSFAGARSSRASASSFVRSCRRAPSCSTRSPPRARHRRDARRPRRAAPDPARARHLALVHVLPRRARPASRLPRAERPHARLLRSGASGPLVPFVRLDLAESPIEEADALPRPRRRAGSSCTRARRSSCSTTSGSPPCSSSRPREGADPDPRRPRPAADRRRARAADGRATSRS